MKNQKNFHKKIKVRNEERYERRVVRDNEVNHCLIKCFNFNFIQLYKIVTINLKRGGLKTAWIVFSFSMFSIHRLIV